MKTWEKMAVVLVVLALGLPSYGEILVYRLTERDTFFEQLDDVWDTGRELARGYMVLDVDYTDPNDPTITQAQVTWYGRDEIGRWFEEIPVEDLELVRAPTDRTVQWVLVQKQITLDGEAIVSDDFTLLSGRALERNVGVEERREAPSAMRGYSLWDEGVEGDRELGQATLSLRLYSAWTRRANGDDPDEGNQDFATVVNFIGDYLTARGYEDITPIDDD